jgi:hypothetical protein
MAGCGARFERFYRAPGRATCAVACLGTRRSHIRSIMRPGRNRSRFACKVLLVTNVRSLIIFNMLKNINLFAFQ